MKLPFWQKDKRRADRELLDQHIHVRLTKSEVDFINSESERQCRSKNSIFRFLIKSYKQKLEDLGKQEEHQ